jgi:hypothetical protein
MINALLSSLATFIVWLVTIVTTDVSLPFFQLVILFAVVFLFVGEVREENDEL